MGQAEVIWLQNQQFVGIDSTRHSVVLSGTGPEDGVGMKPSELLLVALGGCTAYDVVNILSKKRQKLTDLRILVSGEQDSDPPWAFRRSTFTTGLLGAALTRKQYGRPSIFPSISTARCQRQCQAPRRSQRISR